MDPNSAQAYLHHLNSTPHLIPTHGFTGLERFLWSEHQRLFQYAEYLDLLNSALACVGEQKSNRDDLPSNFSSLRPLLYLVFQFTKIVRETDHLFPNLDDFSSVDPFGPPPPPSPSPPAIPSPATFDRLLNHLELSDFESNWFAFLTQRRFIWPRVQSDGTRDGVRVSVWSLILWRFGLPDSHFSPPPKGFPSPPEGEHKSRMDGFFNITRQWGDASTVAGAVCAVAWLLFVEKDETLKWIISRWFYWGARVLADDFEKRGDLEKQNDSDAVAVTRFTEFACLLTGAKGRREIHESLSISAMVLLSFYERTKERRGSRNAAVFHIPWTFLGGPREPENCGKVMERSSQDQIAEAIRVIRPVDIKLEESWPTTKVVRGFRERLKWPDVENLNLKLRGAGVTFVRDNRAQV